jgi:hypothetical protein
MAADGSLPAVLDKRGETEHGPIFEPLNSALETGMRRPSSALHPSTDVDVIP